MEEKFKNLNCGGKDENQIGFFSKMNDFNYEIYINENKENIHSLTINEVAEKQNIKEKNLKFIEKVLNLFNFNKLVINLIDFNFNNIKDILKIKENKNNKNNKKKGKINNFNLINILHISYEKIKRYSSKNGISFLFENFPNIINISFNKINFIIENKNNNNLMIIFCSWIKSEYKKVNKILKLKTLELNECLLNSKKINMINKEIKFEFEVINKA